MHIFFGLFSTHKKKTWSSKGLSMSSWTQRVKHIPLSANLKTCLYCITSRNVTGTVTCRVGVTLLSHSSADGKLNSPAMLRWLRGKENTWQQEETCFQKYGFSPPPSPHLDPLPKQLYRGASGWFFSPLQKFNRRNKTKIFPVHLETSFLLITKIISRLLLPP